MKNIFILIIIVLFSRSLLALDEMTIKYNISNIKQIYDQAWELNKSGVQKKIDQILSNGGYNPEITILNKPYIYFQNGSNNTVKIYSNRFKAFHVKIPISYHPDAHADIYCKLTATLKYDAISGALIIDDIDLNVELKNISYWIALFTEKLFEITGIPPIPPVVGAFGIAFDINYSFDVPTSYQNDLLFELKSLSYSYPNIIAGFDALRPISVSMSGPNHVHVPNKGETNTYTWTASVTNSSAPEYKWYKKYSTSSSWTLVGTNKNYTESFGYFPGSGIKIYYLKVKVYDTGNRYAEATKTITQHYLGGYLPPEAVENDIISINTPTEFALSNNYPNPFNPETTIKYDLPVPSQVNIAIYNTLGICVRQFNMSGESEGFHQFTWDGKSDDGANVASGLYILQFRAISLEDSKIFTKNIKMLLTR